MKKYIFVKPEGLTSKPSFDSPEPDFVEMQIIGFERGSLVQDALKDLIEQNGDPTENKSSAYFSVKMDNTKKNHLWTKGNKSKTSIAS